MSSKRRKKKTDKNDTEVWTEEQYEQYMKGLFGLNFIVGYTEGGVPYGIPLDADNEENIFNINDEELPFS